MSTADTGRREGLHIKLDPSLARLVRIHRAETRESAQDLMVRLLREAFDKKPPKPAA